MEDGVGGGADGARYQPVPAVRSDDHELGVLRLFEDAVHRAAADERAAHLDLGVPLPHRGQFLVERPPARGGDAVPVDVRGQPSCRQQPFVRPRVHQHDRHPVRGRCGDRELERLRGAAAVHAHHDRAVGRWWGADGGRAQHDDRAVGMRGERVGDGSEEQAAKATETT